MQVHLCGVRGSTPAPGPDFVRYGGSTSCVGIARDGEHPHLVLDAGTGLRQLSDVLGTEPFQGTILLSHLHWDHTHGLPFFPAGDRPGSRCRLLVPEQATGLAARAVIDRMLAPPHFPITFDELRGAWSLDTIVAGSSEIEGWRVTAREIPHKGGTTYGYRVEGDGAVLAYLSDHWPLGIGPGPEGWGEYHEAAMALVGGADIVLHDAQYVLDELADKGGFGHSVVDYAVTLATRAGVPRLVLFHHDPWRTDDAIDRIVADQSGATISVEAAVEGTCLQV